VVRLVALTVLLKRVLPLLLAIRLPRGVLLLPTAPFEGNVPRASDEGKILGTINSVAKANVAVAAVEGEVMVELHRIVEGLVALVVIFL
jgi:hypothetical protein